MLKSIERFAFDGPYPMYDDEQRKFVLPVDCPWPKCRAAKGSPCVPSLIFPQYPHTVRLLVAAEYHQYHWATVLGAYGFVAQRLHAATQGRWKCFDGERVWTAVMDDFGYLVPCSKD